MKEANQTPYSRCIFREVFSDEQSVRRNGGVPTGVTISKGIGSFNGTSSYIKYNKVLNGVYSVRIKAKNIKPSVGYTYMDFRNSSGTGTGYVTGGSLNFGVSSGTVYVNGVASNSVNVTSSDIVITGMTINCFEIFVNTRYNLTNWLGSDVDLVEIYQGTLTDSEIKNLYRNSWAKGDIKKDLLLDYDSTNGYITDRTGKNTLTATDVSIKKTGGFYGADFNGTTSLIDTGSDFIGTKAVTVCVWINSKGAGGSNVPRILDNGITTFIADKNNDYFSFTSIGGIYALSGANSYELNKLQFVAVTRKANGEVNFYIGGKDTSPVLSVSAKNSGTPAAGTTNIIIGNKSDATRTFDGNIPMLKVYEGILDLEQLTQIWSSTRGKIE